VNAGFWTVKGRVWRFGRGGRLGLDGEAKGTRGQGDKETRGGETRGKVSCLRFLVSDTT